LQGTAQVCNNPSMICRFACAIVIFAAGCAPAIHVAAVSEQSIAIDRRVGIPLQRSFDAANAQCGGRARFRHTELVNNFQERDHYECVR
jgi:hypothetical protein